MPVDFVYIYILIEISRASGKPDIEDNSKVIFLISQRKHTLWPLIRTVLTRRFLRSVTKYVFIEKFGLSLKTPVTPLYLEQWIIS